MILAEEAITVLAQISFEISVRNYPYTMQIPHRYFPYSHLMNIFHLDDHDLGNPI